MPNKAVNMIILKEKCTVLVIIQTAYFSIKSCTIDLQLLHIIRHLITNIKYFEKKKKAWKKIYLAKKICEMIFSKLKFTSDENITQNTIDRIKLTDYHRIAYLQ